MTDSITQFVLFFGSYGLIVAIPCALLIMRKWPRSRVVVATSASLAALLYASIVTDVMLRFRAGLIDSQLVHLMWTGSIALGVGSLGYLATGIVGFVWAARTGQAVRGTCRDGRTTLEGEENSV